MSRSAVTDVTKSATQYQHVSESATFRGTNSEKRTQEGYVPLLDFAGLNVVHGCFSLVAAAAQYLRA